MNQLLPVSWLKPMHLPMMSVHTVIMNKHFVAKFTRKSSLLSSPFIPLAAVRLPLVSVHARLPGER